jgi:hypothetical protein
VSSLVAGVGRAPGGGAGRPACVMCAASLSDALSQKKNL